MVPEWVAGFLRDPPRLPTNHPIRWEALKRAPGCGPQNSPYQAEHPGCPAPMLERCPRPVSSTRVGWYCARYLQSFVPNRLEEGALSDLLLAIADSSYSPSRRGVSPRREYDATAVGGPARTGRRGRGSHLSSAVVRADVIRGRPGCPRFSSRRMSRTLRSSKLSTTSSISSVEPYETTSSPRTSVGRRCP